MKVRANVNFALIKYWGKKDEDLKIPYQSSLSFTVDNLYTETEVIFDNDLTKDIININGITKDDKRVIKHMDLIRKEFNVNKYAYITSKNFVATEAGLASSASAFAALTLAATKALNLNLSKKELSIIARKGSGSASRSIYSDFAIWHHGTNDLDSFAEPIDLIWDDFRIIVCIINDNKKVKSSSQAMKESVLNKKVYNNWVLESEKDLKEMLKALPLKDIDKVGIIAERNALLMHEVIEKTNTYYRTKESFLVIDKVKELREKGIKAYITMDAGPNVKIITTKAYVDDILNEFKNIKTLICKNGDGAKVI